MAYDNQTTYNKFNSKGCICEDKDHCTCGHKEHKEHGCGCKGDDKCGCCPVGLVSVEDSDGKNIGCLSPNDAELYMKNTFKCNDGYIRVLDEEGVFIGCLTAADFAVYRAALA